MAITGNIRRLRKPVMFPVMSREDLRVQYRRKDIKGLIAAGLVFFVPLETC